MAKNGIISVPASVEDVQAFVDQNRNKYEKAVADLKDLLAELRKTERSLACIYKVYSRGEMQGGEEMKATRKIRLKFDEHNLKQKLTEASLYDVPDIVGVTVVVPNPSDISLVAQAIDKAIDNEELIAAPVGKAAAGTLIKSKHGRPIETGGYFACHYNIRLTSMTAATPLCEIQIKTLLHDAWGAKTHDLTYKPSGKVGAELLTSFELLGSSLANLDQQSDVLRQSILRNSAVRDAKRRNVQTCVLAMTTQSRIDRISTGTVKTKLGEIMDEIRGMTVETPDSVARPASKTLETMYSKNPAAVSALLCLLAAMVQSSPYIEKALESLSAREENESDPFLALQIRFQGALAAFAVGDAPRAIDIAESCFKEAQKAKKEKTFDADRLDNLMFSVSSDLAYYHADIIGSHEGDKRKSSTKALTHLKEAMKFYASLGVPKDGLAADEGEIVQALKGAKDPLRIFFALDNEAYVKIQTASTVSDVRKAAKMLNFLHTHVPKGGEDAAGLAVEYHEYCSRQRLADLEGEAVS
ncbi:hypothetical protein QUC32_02540 [Novosphingobium resinovorum]|uniref:hypothetical protein n=1 Tax=Novosphingobium TaxID=165696 RepID=UPI001B3C763D|nr:MULTISPECIES: hypothetical protein [Novosphingobium]MBF7013718.1 hypothetical protein [Novosphingobium sp. HR1a]WJM25860.1 hypothetical protein QUC32_02540 [Novosphingobium resinovorum]